ncbi:TPA: hypothetical protein ACGR7J_001565 [Escherichia coli]|jgi:hypothetical protein|nr:hypothetical protein [Escherichia coli]DAL10672.1 MAG TPA_asm: hypothetical protein [Caudoviricetes sp.]
MAEFTKQSIIEDLKASTQNASGMFEISEDTICALMSMLTSTAPQLPQPAVLSVSEGVLKSLLPDVEKSEFWFEHNGKIFFEGVRFNNAVFEACRAAMLQGKAAKQSSSIKTSDCAGQGEDIKQASSNEPVSQPYKLPAEVRDAINRLLDSDGSRGTFSAFRCADAREELERLLAAEPVSQRDELPANVIDALEKALQAMSFMGDTLNTLDAVCEEDVEYVTPAFEAVREVLEGNSPAIPDGWVAVPVEPTIAILDEFDSIIDYGAEDSKDAWSRLLAAAWIKSLPAAPRQEVK